MRLLVFTALLAAGLAAAPSSHADEAGDARLKGIVTAFVDDYARPAYAHLHAAANDLDAATAGYCAAPAAATRAALGTAFADTVAAWAAVDFLRFGPATQKARLERMAFWPDPRGFTEKQLRPLVGTEKGDTIDLAGLAGQSAAVQGLPAFERLVLAPDADPAAPDFARRCRLAGLVADNLVAISGELDAAWQAPDGIARSLENAGPGDGAYRSPAEAAGEVLKAVVTLTEQVRDLAILPALGDAPASAKPQRFPYAKSGTTVVYLKASVGAVAALIDKSRLADDLPEDDAYAKDSMLFEIRSAERALDGLKGTPEEIARSPDARAKLGYVRIALASVRTTLVGPVSSGLGLTMGFNALDGD